MRYLLLGLLFFSITSHAEEDFLSELGENLQGCPDGCSCISDINRQAKAKRKLGEVETEDDTGAKDIKTRSK